MQVNDPRAAPAGAARTITDWPLRENARPVGFAPWPEVEEARPPTPDRKRKKGKREKSRVDGDVGGAGRRKRGGGDE